MSSSEEKKNVVDSDDEASKLFHVLYNFSEREYVGQPFVAI